MKILNFGYLNSRSASIMRIASIVFVLCYLGEYYRCLVYDDWDNFYFPLLIDYVIIETYLILSDLIYVLSPFILSLLLSIPYKILNPNTSKKLH